LLRWLSGARPTGPAPPPRFGPDFCPQLNAAPTFVRGSTPDVRLATKVREDAVV